MNFEAFLQQEMKPESSPKVVPERLPEPEVERRLPSRIQLVYAKDWLESFPMIDRVGILCAPESRCHWLVDWLSPKNRLTFGVKGELPWREWNGAFTECRRQSEEGRRQTSEEVGKYV